MDVPLLSDVSKPASVIQKRRVLSLLVFCGLFVVYAQRVCISIAAADNCKHGMQVEFNWSNGQQSLVLSSFFYGYITNQFAGGYLSERIGAKLVFGISVTFASLGTLLSALTAPYFPALIASRIFTGFAEAWTYPCVHALMAEWAPAPERSVLLSFAWSGAYLGTGLAMPISSILLDKVSWQSVFYVWCSLGIVWVILWMTFAASRPSEHLSISEAELEYISQHVKKKTVDPLTGRKPKPDAWKIATCPAVWACIAGHTVYNWLVYLLLTELPSFMKDVLGFELSKSGFLSGLPFLTLFLTQTVAGFYADWLIEKGHLSVINVRRSFMSFGLLAAGGFLISTAFVNDSTLATAMMVCSVAVVGTCASGYGCSILDIATDDASYIYALSNTFATLPGILSPLVTGALLDRYDCKSSGSRGCREAYQVLFVFSATVVMGGGALIYSIMVKSEKLFR